MLSETPTPGVFVSWLYGDAKRMKTSALLAAFPNALWLGPAYSAINLVAQSEYGFEPYIWDKPVDSFDELRWALDDVEKYVGDYGTVCIDDVTLISSVSIRQWKEDPQTVRNNFFPYIQLAATVGELADWARQLGVNVGFTSHMREPGTDDKGQFTPGGIDLGGKNPVKKMPGWCDLMVSSRLDPGYPDPWMRENGCGVSWRCLPFDKNWVSGDRHGICWSNTPPRLREVIAAAATPYYCPRLSGLEWQDDVAEETCLLILGGMAPHLAAGKVAAHHAAFLAKGGKRELHLRGAVQDGIARAIIRLRMQRGLFAPERLAPPTPKRGPPPKKPGGGAPTAGGANGDAATGATGANGAEDQTPATQDGGTAAPAPSTASTRSRTPPPPPRR